MLKRLIKRVLFGRKRRNKRKPIRYNFVTWRAHDKLDSKVSNLIKYLGLEEVKNTSLVGDRKDAKKFDNQWNH
tara:strand:- start:297 stop:515 length:219 start_codon:yes stop_codon:yes gene_type:complete